MAKPHFKIFALRLGVKTTVEMRLEVRKDSIHINPLRLQGLRMKLRDRNQAAQSAIGRIGVKNSHSHIAASVPMRLPTTTGAAAPERPDLLPLKLRDCIQWSSWQREQQRRNKANTS